MKRLVSEMRKFTDTRFACQAMSQSPCKKLLMIGMCFGRKVAIGTSSSSSLSSHVFFSTNGEKQGKTCCSVFHTTRDPSCLSFRSRPRSLTFLQIKGSSVNVKIPAVPFRARVNSLPSSGCSAVCSALIVRTVRKNEQTAFTPFCFPHVVSPIHTRSKSPHMLQLILL